MISTRHYKDPETAGNSLADNKHVANLEKDQIALIAGYGFAKQLQTL
ncbi:MAG TPA: hypothetical protein VGU61_06435 [Noviherbaspirillum sp.]|jgi:hypothetical protein|nr:hypothetical protein [Noviherbaspirillum sp.]